MVDGPGANDGRFLSSHQIPLLSRPCGRDDDEWVDTASMAELAAKFIIGFKHRATTRYNTRRLMADEGEQQKLYPGIPAEGAL